MDFRLQKGTVLDQRYRIEGILGSGGFGITYEGVVLHHPQTKVAIKELFIRKYMKRDASLSEEVSLTDEVFRHDFEDAKEHFLREAILIGILNKEPGVVNVIDRFKANGTAYIVMEYVDGETLSQYVQKHGAFTDRDIFKRMLPVAETLEKVHANEVIHCDISPENVMVLRDGSLKLIDFGSAENELDEESGNRTVRDGYTPVEQYQKEEKMGPWTDIYGLCATIYFCVTGKMPEPSIERLLYDEQMFPTEMGIRMDAGLEEILKKGMMTDPALRYQHMEEWIEAVRMRIPEEKKSSGIWKIWAGAGLILCICVLLGYGYRDYREKNKFNGIETQSMVLVPDSSMTVNAYMDAKTTIEERVGILAGDMPFEVEEAEDGNLKVTMPLASFASADAKKMTELMISGEWRADLGKYEKDSGTHIRCAIKPTDIEKAALMLGKAPEMTSEQEALIHPEIEPYLSITMTDEKAEEIRELFPEDHILNLYLSFDTNETLHDAVTASLSLDGKQIYLFGSFLKMGSFGELLRYNLTHEGFEHSFTLYCDIASDWEIPDDTLLSGEYQRRESMIADPSVTVSYGQNEQSAVKISKGEWAYILVTLQERLDALKIPYAIGAEKDDAKEIVLKMDRLNASAFLTDTIMEKGYMAVIGSKWEVYQTPISEKSTTRSLIRKEDGTYRYAVRFDEAEWETFRTFTENVVRDGEQELYIRLGQYYLAQCTIDTPVTDGYVEFDRLCDEDLSEITEESRSLFDYLGVFSQDTNAMVHYGLNKRVFTDENGDIDTKNQFEPKPPVRDFGEEFMESVSMRYPDITFEKDGREEGKGIYVNLNLELSDQFVENALDMVEDIYRTCGIGDGWLNNLTFTLTSEHEEDKECAKIYFGKQEGHWKNEYGIHVLFQNGRMELYREELIRQMQEREFYKERISILNGQEMEEQNF